MKVSTIKSTWLPKGGYRLDCSPYLGGAIETEILLEELPVRKDSLGSVTKAIYHAGRESRLWVEDPEFGIPFIGSSDLQKADLSDLPLIAKSQVAKNSQFLIHKGYTLITRSGTIGKMAYCRPEMDGMACSEHVLRVVPNEVAILPGYLYAFLSSRFGVPLVVAGTYGSIIQAIEPSHVAGLSVPRFGDAIEQEIHQLVEAAARLRSEASELKRRAINRFGELCKMPTAKPLRNYPSPLYGKATSNMLGARMDATYYIPPCSEARDAFDQSGANKALGEVARVFIPGIFKRQYSDDPDFGYPYITGADVFSIRPRSDQYLLKSVAEGHGLVLERGMILIHEAGQRYGLIGNSVMVGDTLAGFACTNNMVRVFPNDPEEAGYIYSVLCSEYGIRLLKREAAGSSIPHLDESRARSLRIPWPKAEIRTEIASVMHQARSNWDKADDNEEKALRILADAILKP